MPARIELDNCAQSFVCADDLNVLRGMECLGLKGIPVGCRGGGCGVCKVRVLAGEYHTAKMSRACVSQQEETDGYVLACRLFALSDLRLEVVGKMLRAFHRSTVGSNAASTPQTHFTYYGGAVSTPFSKD